MMNKRCLASDGIIVEVMSWTTIFICVLFMFSAWIIYVSDSIFFHIFVLILTTVLSLIIPIFFAGIAGCFDTVDENA